MKQLNLLLSFIYPNYCGICGRINENGLCKKCEIKLKQEECYHIDSYRNNSFEEHTYLFLYQGIIREKLIEYKFQKKPYLARMFATLIKNKTELMKKIINYDYIIPVPIHPKRKQQRGYNQSELILKYIITEKVKINTNILKKKINNLSQSSLNKEERKENVKDVYQIKQDMEKRVNHKRILLFDDIYTTGSTVRECSNLLKQAGAAKIHILTIAKD